MKSLLDRFLLFFTGATVFMCINYLFDFVLYPFVIYELGLLTGFFVMVFLSFVACLIYFKVYDHFKKDFLAIEYAKEKLASMSALDQATYLKRLFAKFVSRSRVFLFVFLSVYFDPFVATAFERKGAYQYNGMSARDWRIFILSLMVSNGFWACGVFVGISFFQFMWQLIVRLFL